MSLNTGTAVKTNSNARTINYTATSVFIFGNDYHSGEYANSSGASVTITLGDVLGKIGTSGNIVPLNTGATDGSQLPIGIAAETITVADGGSSDITYCISGEVNEGAVNVAGSSTLDTVVSNRRIRDRLQSDTLGIQLITSTDLTDHDNS